MTLSEAHVQIEKDSGAAESKRSPGRPKDVRLDATILNATLELLAERGLSALSIESAAERAGVGKATIYRRWTSRDEIVAAAFANISETIEVPDTGNVRDDLIELLAGLQQCALRSLPAALLPRLLALSITSPELLQTFLANAFAPRRAAVLGILERARSRGELREDVDIELAFMMLSGASVLMALLDKDADLANPALPRRLVDTLVGGLLADG